jgi:anti-sigma regulatory factor (Ser/Thr protein kinase)
MGLNRGLTMVAIRLSSFEDVRMARECARDLARAAGVHDPGAVAQAAGELANNCVEHGNEHPGLLWIGCRQGRLSLRFENPCEQRPTWCTQKPMAFDEFRTGGYGLQIARALARSIHCRWADGRVVVRAEFV